MRSILRLSGLSLAILLGPSVASIIPTRADRAGAMPSQRRSSAVAGGQTIASGSGQTVYDRRLNVTWLATGDLASRKTFGVPGISKDGSMSYQTAVKWVRAMNTSNHGKGYLDHNTWRLPATPTPSVDSSCSSDNRKGGGAFGYGCVSSALASLYKRTLDLPEPGTAVPIPDLQTRPFHDFQPYLYWTGTTIVVKHHTGYRTLSFNTGWQGSNVPFHSMYVLPMLPGNPFGTPAGSDARLDPSADGTTVYDPAAGVTWLADADLAKSTKFGVSGINVDGSMEEETAADWISAMNKAAWLGQRHWQLPPGGGCDDFRTAKCSEGPVSELYYHGLNRKQGEPVVATPATRLDGFQNIQPYLYWSCAGSNIQGACTGAPAKGFQWSFSFENGFQGTDRTQNELYVIVYYPAATPSPARPAPRPPSPCPPQLPGKPSTCK